MELKTQYEYKALVTKVVDGDTFDAIVDLGYRINATIRFRVKNFDAPESFRPKDDDEFKRGNAAKIEATSLLYGKTVVIQSYKEGVYNRWEAVVTLPDGKDFAQLMIQLGHSK